jgi:osmotically-inducible protein OsmY
LEAIHQVTKEKVMTESDRQLKQYVHEELRYEPGLDASRIDVTAENGVIILNGSVDSFAEKKMATRAAERVERVQNVRNEMKVDLPSNDVRKDADISAAALTVLEWDVQVPTHLVKVKVEDGWISLSGEVDFKFQQIAAENAVRNLRRVRGVSNLISPLKAGVEPTEIKAVIGNALRQAAEQDAERIRVGVSGDKVILRGNVRSWAERTEAETAAQSAPGVCRVENDLVIVE